MSLARDIKPTPPATTRELPTAPYLEAIVSYGFRGSVRFHVPGHKGGPGADPGLRSAMGERALALDICQDIEGIDLGPSPTPYERAEELAAAAYGAGQTWFLTNGATQGNHALCLALAKPGRHVLVQRNSHASVVDGLVLSGGRASFVTPEFDEELGMAHGVTPAALQAALERSPTSARRSSSRRPITEWQPTSAAVPRSPTPPEWGWSSTAPGARISGFTPPCPSLRCAPGRTPY